MMRRRTILAALCALPLVALAIAPTAAQETRTIRLPAPAAATPAAPPAPQPSGAVAAWPQTPAGRQAAGYVAALNDPDPAVLDRFMAEHYPKAPLAILGQTPMIRERLGTLQLVAIERETPTTLAALVKSSKSTQEIRLLLQVEAEPPNDIVRIGLALGASARGLSQPAAPPPERIDDPALATATKAYLETLPDFSGAVLVARGGETVFSAAKGLADREGGQANTPATRFRVGSMDKMFTGVAILQLVQAGKVQLDAPLGRYLKGYPNQEFARKATIRQLLSHSAGAGDIFGPEFDVHRAELKTLKDYQKLYGARSATFEPGTGSAYANYGFILLGRVVEEVSGESYYDYVARHIFAPAGMTATGFEPEEVAVAGRARGYLKQGEAFRSNADTLPYRGTSAGGGYSTVEDFAAFARALTAHKLLDAAHTELAFSGKPAAQGATPPGYGFGEAMVAGARTAGHSGGAPGMNGDLRFFTDGGGIVVVLSNVSPPALAPEISRFIVSRMKPS